jgi:hypothetical protein
MEEYFDKLFDDSFLVAIQVNNTDSDLNSHKYGLKRKNINIYDDRVVALPNSETKNGKDFSNLAKDIYEYKPYNSISIANIRKDLYCEMFKFSEKDLKRIIKYNSYENYVEEEFGWFIYSYMNYLYYRIPKELVVGSIKYDDNLDQLSFIENANYYMNLNKKDREKFLRVYKELVLNEIENEDYDNEYPYNNISVLSKKLVLN